VSYPAEPTLATIAERLRDRTAPLAPDDAAYGFAHAYLCGALGEILREVAEAFDPDGDIPPIAPLLDPELCPEWALPWLAQFVGVAIPQGATEAQARNLITQALGFRRGTRAAFEAALDALGIETAYFRERANGDPYALEIVVPTSELPSDPSVVLPALMSQKPGGIVLTYRTVAGWDYTAMTTAGGTYTALKTKYLTYQGLTYNEPGT
jgi:Phage tail protein (Tail_P2_I)